MSSAIKEALDNLGDDSYTPEFTESSYRYLPFVFTELRKFYAIADKQIQAVEYFKITEPQGRLAELVLAKVTEVTGIKISIITDPGCKEKGLLDKKSDIEKREIRALSTQAKGVDFTVIGSSFVDKWDLKIRKCEWHYGDFLLQKKLFKDYRLETDFLLYIKEVTPIEDSTISILPIAPLRTACSVGVIWRPWGNNLFRVEDNVVRKILDGVKAKYIIDQKIYN